MPKAEYRSSIRSKNLIKKAVAKLIHEKEISKITVSDIIREADISRGTFYAHYADVSSVIEQIECEELKNLIDFVDEFGFDNITDNIGLFLGRMCEYLNRDIEYYRMLSQTKILNNFLWRLVEIYYERLLDATLETECTENRAEADIYLLYVTSGAKTVILSWLNGDIKGTPHEIAEIVSKLINLNRKFYEK